MHSKLSGRLRSTLGDKDREAVVWKPQKLLNVLKGIWVLFSWEVSWKFSSGGRVFNLVSQVQRKAIFSQTWAWQDGAPFWAVIHNLTSSVNSRNPCATQGPREIFNSLFTLRAQPVQDSNQWHSPPSEGSQPSPRESPP